MKSLHEQLNDIKQYSYQMSVHMVGLVRDNYEKILARKEKEFEQKLNMIRKSNKRRFRRQLTRKRY